MKMFKKLMLVSLAFATQAMQVSKVEANVIARLSSELPGGVVRELWTARLKVIDSAFAALASSTQKRQDMLRARNFISDYLGGLGKDGEIDQSGKRSLEDIYQMRFVNNLSLEARNVIADLEAKVDRMLPLPGITADKLTCLELLQFDARRELAKVTDPFERQVIKYASEWMQRRLMDHVDMVVREMNYNTHAKQVEAALGADLVGFFYANTEVAEIRSVVDADERKAISDAIEKNFDSLMIWDAVFTSLVARVVASELWKAIEIIDGRLPEQNIEDAKQAMLYKLYGLRNQAERNWSLIPAQPGFYYERFDELATRAGSARNQGELDALLPVIAKLEQDFALALRNKKATNIQKVMRGRWGRKTAEAARDERDARVAAEKAVQAARAEKEARELEVDRESLLSSSRNGMSFAEMNMRRFPGLYGQFEKLRNEIRRAKSPTELAALKIKNDELQARVRNAAATSIQRRVRGDKGRKTAQDARAAKLAAEKAAQEQAQREAAVQAARAEKEARKSAARSSLKQYAQQVGRESLRKVEEEKRTTAATKIQAAGRGMLDRVALKKAQEKAAKEVREAQEAERVAEQKRREAAQAAAEAEEARLRAEKERSEAEAAKIALAKEQQRVRDLSAADARWQASGATGPTNVGFDQAAQDRLSEARRVAMSSDPKQADYVSDIKKALEGVLGAKGIARFTTLNAAGDNIKSTVDKLNDAGKSLLRAEMAGADVTLLREAREKQKISSPAIEAIVAILGIA